MVSPTLTYMPFDVIVGMEDAPQVCFVETIGMAKLMHWAIRMMAVLILMTRVRVSSKGPPQLPGAQRDVSLNDVLDQLSHATSQGSTKGADHPADTVD